MPRRVAVAANREFADIPPSRDARPKALIVRAPRSEEPRCAAVIPWAGPAAPVAFERERRKTLRPLQLVSIRVGDTASDRRDRLVLELYRLKNPEPASRVRGERIPVPRVEPEGLRRVRALSIRLRRERLGFQRSARPPALTPFKRRLGPRSDRTVRSG